MSYATNWVFTINNPTPRDEDIITEELPYKYLVFQYEMGNNGTVHIQAYCVLKQRMRMRQLKAIHDKAHWEVRKGTHEQARDYCMKSKTALCAAMEFGSEQGIAKKRGQRTDLIKVKETIDSGASLEELVDKHFAEYLRYHNGIEKVMAMKHLDRDPNVTPEVLIYWGPTGTGKTRKATEENPDAYLKKKPATRTGVDFWQHYAGQKTVIFDEFYSWITYDEILRIVDRYKYYVEIKGRDHKLCATKFIFTSNLNPEAWYRGPNSKVKDRSAWDRRIEEWGKIYYFEVDGTITENGGPPYVPEPEEENFSRN